MRSEVEKSAFVVIPVGSVLPDGWPRSSAWSPAGDTFQRGLINALAAAGCKVARIISFSPERAFPKGSKLFVRGGIGTVGDQSVRCLPYPNIVPIKQLWVGLLAAIFLAIGSLRLRLLGIRPLVLLYNLSMPPAIMTILAAKFAGAKVVGMIADLDIPGETVPYSILHRLDYALQRRLIRILDGLLPISDAIAADFFPGRRYVRVSGGIDTSIVDSFAQRRPRDTRVLRVAFAGSLDKANGVEIILEAVTLLKTLDLRVEIAGRGPLEESVRRAALQDSRIAYLGFLGRAEVYEMYKRADVLLNIRLTSANRTPYLFPSKLTEYISAGAYVVTTNVGHAKDLLADRASFLNEETPAALSSLLKQLSEHDPAGLRDQGERCRERVLSELSWTTQGVRIRDYFESLL